MEIMPFLQSLHLVDEAIQEEKSGKVTLRGIFDTIEVEASATSFSSAASLFFMLGNIHREVKLRLCYVDLEENSVLLERSVPVTSDAPLTYVAVVIPLQKMPVPHPGIYAWELYWNQEMIGSCRINAKFT